MVLSPVELNMGQITMCNLAHLMLLCCRSITAVISHASAKVCAATPVLAAPASPVITPAVTPRCRV